MASLYQLTENYQHAFWSMAELEAIDPQIIDDTLEGLEGEFEGKAINVAAFFQNLEAEADAIREAEKRMAARRKSLENQAERFRDYLKQSMLAVGILKISCPEFAVSVQKSPTNVVIVDEALIPLEFIRTKTITEPDKIAIKAAGNVPGTRLEEGFSLRIK